MKKELFTKKKDFITQKKGLPTYTKQTHGKKPRQIAAPQIATVNNHAKECQQCYF